jgi:hypothetical protein
MFFLWRVIAALRPAHWSRTALMASAKAGLPCVYAQAVIAAPLKIATNSALIWSALVAGIPCGKPGHTFNVACFSIVAEIKTAAPRQRATPAARGTASRARNKRLAFPKFQRCP